MVQTDIAQLISECTDWRQILRNYRDEFQENNKLLQGPLHQHLTKNQLQDVEHYHNQLHIQLINIHDLKQTIKTHERKVRLEAAGRENLSDDVYQHHERLLEEFTNLENTLQELRSHFKKFVSSLNS